MPPLCKFWQQGNCRYGDRCKFLHTTEQAGQYNNRSNSHEPSHASNSRSQSANQNRAPVSAALPYQLDKAAILTDLKEERPQWILSAYGPGRNAPAQLFGGPLREQSFEEMRLLHYIGLASGNAQQAVIDAETLWTASEQQIQTALNDIDGAIKFLIGAENEHPNRIDIVRESQLRIAGSSQPNPFNAPVLVQPASTSNPFGGPSSQPTAPAFGVHSAQPGAFGQPSVSSQGSTNFGRPSQPAASGAFGQPSLLGQRPNPFGSTPTNNVGLTAMPNPVSQQNLVSNPFGKPSQPAQFNPFGTPSSHHPAPAFGQSPSAPNQPFGAQPASSNAFGAPLSNQPQSSSNAFGQPQPALSTFGQPQPQPPVSTNLSGQSQSLTPGINQSFGGQSFNGQSTATSTPFGSTPQSQILTADGTGRVVELNVSRRPLNSYSTKDASGRLTMFKGKRVVYKGDEAGFTNREGKWEKIWFPDGPPKSFKDNMVPDDFEYDEQTVASYTSALKTGKFEGGMPMLPPKPEWVRYNF